MNFLQRIINYFSIKQKLIALGMIVSSIATIITCTGFIIFNNASERSDLVDEIRLVSRIFSEELSEYILHGEKDQILKSLNALKNRESLIETCIYTHNDDKEFIEFIKDKKRGVPCSKIPKVKGRYEFRDDNILGEHLIVSSYIAHNDQKIGYLIMVANLDRIHSRTEQGILNSLALFFFIILISYLISRFLQKTISNPIMHLADISYIVKEGNYYVRAKHYADDELGILTQAYNDMLKEIQHAQEHLEEKVIERTLDLEKAMQVKAQFLSNMSHEIRTPIHGIMNYVDFLVHDWEILTKEHKYNFIQKLHSNSNRLLSLINNLLDLSKLDAGKMEFVMQKNNLATLVESSIQESEALYSQKKDLSIIFNPAKSVSYSANFDYERIAQVIRNLLSNAIKFTPHGKIILHLELTKLKKDNGHNIQAIKFSIIDEGIGIPADELEYIFDKFNQSAKTKTGAGGTGLGLAISRDIINAHDGKIWAENNKDAPGSIFTFIIPIHQHSKSKNIL